MSYITRTQKEKLEHYAAVANGSKATKAGAKFSEAEQRAYARGQRDARNENNRLFAWKNATPEQRAAYKAKKRAERQAYKNGKKRNENRIDDK